MSKITKQLWQNKDYRKKQIEAHKGHKFSKETKKRMSEARKGKKCPWAGKYKKTEDHKRKLSEVHKGMKKPWAGKYKRTLETRKHMSEQMKKSGRKPPSQLGMKGSKSGGWKGGVTKKNTLIRNSREFDLWRKSVFARDNYTCQKTGKKGGELHPHHIQNFAQFPELRFVVSNGITLSEKSHKKFHRIYGTKNNTKKQIKEFLEN